ncbi:MAG: hypothetical protein VX877_09965, partial [Planctomycetota bacterium]|nr:hypothetical protein [Planctomycetota bacterium]
MPILTRLLIVSSALAVGLAARAHTAEPKFSVRVVKNSSTGDYRKLRKMITGPELNEHPDYQGCTGFVGWESVIQLRNGDL